MNRREWRWVALVTLALVTASSLPYLVAWIVTPDGAHFTGLIFNPQDGNSYIAKMRQGFAGSWLFHLAFTPERHHGAYIFSFHLLLGHVARWVGLPLIVVYHIARVAGGVVMLLALYGLASRLSDDVGERGVMFLLAALGSGLGWLVGVMGVMTSDLWVQEAFPAYALLANAHFPLAIGLMVGMVNNELRMTNGGQREWLWGLGMVLSALALGVVQPFGLLPVFGGLGVTLAARTVRMRRVPWRAVAWVTGAGVMASPYPLYMQWAMRTDPVLAAWNVQNVTPSPPLWDWALSYGLVLALAMLGAVLVARRGSGGDWLLLGWAGVTLVGMYLPLPLQRRLSLGLGVPLGLLAGMGWWRVVRPRVRVRRRGLLQRAMVTFCALTPVFLVLMTLLAALAGEPWFYLSEGEWAALEWLRDEGQPDAVVLCAPQMGLFVPAWAGQPVVYGHPFETVDAEWRKGQVETFWAGGMGLAEQEVFLQENRVGYVLVGPRELEIGGWRMENGEWRTEIGELEGEPVFEADGVRVYEVTGGHGDTGMGTRGWGDRVTR
ncbi:MAG: hypothetical protein SWK90_07520 [Chloroflexota bacterium]|nr:hypothetical protein [Chloroflexota bacterium]